MKTTKFIVFPNFEGEFVLIRGSNIIVIEDDLTEMQLIDLKHVVSFDFNGVLFIV